MELRRKNLEDVERYEDIHKSLLEWYWEEINKLRGACRRAICSLSTHYKLPLRGKLKEQYGACC
jgi:hypothetical protein